MKRMLMTGAIILGSFVSFNASAQLADEDAQTAVADRQAVFKVLGHSMAPLGGMARGAEYDDAAAKLSAERIIMLADMIPEVFTADTTGNDVDTRALDSIWANMDDFNGLAADLKAGAEAALATLESSGSDGVRQAVGQIGQKCGACHDRFRLD